MNPASFTPAWLVDDPAAVALLPRAYAAPDQRALAVRRAAARRIEPAVLAALGKRAASPAAKAHLEALAASGAACVVTGQQAGLFGGPLYCIYKTAAAIINARALSAETGVPCVPVFWVQSEDHYFPEVAAAHALDARGQLVRVAWAEDAEDRRRSIGHRRYGADVDVALAGLLNALGHGSAVDAVAARLRAHYRAGVGPATAFAGLMADLFADAGLLVLDPTDPRLAAAAAPVHRRALDAAAQIDAALQARSEALQTAGFAVQVTLRPGSPLTFYRPAAIDGPRHRLEPDGAGRWRLIGAEGVLTPAELHAALEAEPGRFATSALLRPILQDLWLPTAAYVSGPGELAYWAQMPPLYTVFGLDVPLVIPRARLQIADETTHRLLEQLGLTLADLDRDREALLARCARPSADHPRPEAIGRALLEPLQATLTAFAPHAEAVDKGLAQAAKRTGEAIEDLAGRLIDRYRRALIAGDDVAAARLDRLLARMRPNGGPQERTLGWPTFAARLGVAPFIDAALAAISPYDGTLRTLTP